MTIRQEIQKTELHRRGVRQHHARGLQRRTASSDQPLFQRPKSALVLSLLPLLLLGCTVGPDYVAPDFEAPEAFAEAPDSPVVDASAAASWWSQFEDPRLESLIADAIANNRDLAASLERVRQSRAQLRIAESAGLPQAGASASALRQRSSENSPQAQMFSALGVQPDPHHNLFSSGLDLSWEIDLFGNVSRAEEAALARYQASEYTHHGATLLVASEVADAYLAMRGLMAQRRVQEETVRTQRETLELVNQRYQAGIDSELAQLQAQAQFEGSQATLPRLEAGIRAQAYRLAILLGRTPDESKAWMEDSSSALDDIASPELPSLLPGAVLQQRPDVAVAERRLAASVAVEGVATAAFYPRIRFGAGGALISADEEEAWDLASRSWSFGPSLSLPLFQGGRLRAQLAAARDGSAAALAEWEQTVLRALGETETAYVNVREERATRIQLEAAVASNRAATERARALYQNGLTDFIAVLDAERRLSEVESALAQSRTQELRNTVTLYRALGGGWQSLRGELADLR